MKAQRSFQRSGIAHPKTGLHVQEELNLLTATSFVAGWEVSTGLMMRILVF
jgi:hypothetical protein